VLVSVSIVKLVETVDIVNRCRVDAVVMMVVNDVGVKVMDMTEVVCVVVVTWLVETWLLVAVPWDKMVVVTYLVEVRVIGSLSVTCTYTICRTMMSS
jgi:hypothetical protein